MKNALLLLLLLLVLAAPNAAAQLPTGRVLNVSDLHFNPFYDSALAGRLLQTVQQPTDTTNWRYLFQSSPVQAPNPCGQDTNYPLLATTLQAVRQQVQPGTLVLITGDFLAHSFEKTYGSNGGDTAHYRRFVARTYQFLAQEIQRTLPPHTVVLVGLGNNDTDGADYAPPTPAFLRRFAQAWVPLMHHATALADTAFVHRFMHGGYYVGELPGTGGGQLVMLNTVLFSSHATTYALARRELAWLADTLRQGPTRGARLWVAGHIPPGMDVYATRAQWQSNSCTGAITPTALHCPIDTTQVITLWDNAISKEYFKRLFQHERQIGACFAGHTHMDEFRVLYDSTNRPGAFVHIAPAVTRLFGNNTGFQVFTYAPQTLTLLNLQTYYLPPGTPDPAKGWVREYDFQKQYQVGAFSAGSLDALRRRLEASGPARPGYLAYSQYFTVSNQLLSDSLVRKYWRYYWCSMQGNRPAGAYGACVCQQPALALADKPRRKPQARPRRAGR